MDQKDQNSEGTLAAEAVRSLPFPRSIVGLGVFLLATAVFTFAWPPFWQIPIVLAPVFGPWLPLYLGVGGQSLGIAGIGCFGLICFVVFALPFCLKRTTVRKAMLVMSFASWVVAGVLGWGLLWGG